MKWRPRPYETKPANARTLLNGLNSAWRQNLCASKGTIDVVKVNFQTDFGKICKMQQHKRGETQRAEHQKKKKRYKSKASFHFSLFLPESESESVKGSLIRLMYSVANGAGSFEGWAESRYNDSHSFALKGQLSQTEALWKEPNLVRWTNPGDCNLAPGSAPGQLTPLRGPIVT